MKYWIGLYISMNIDADDENMASDKISELMNQTFSPKEIFVIECIKRKVSIKGVTIN